MRIRKIADEQIHLAVFSAVAQFFVYQVVAFSCGLAFLVAVDGLVINVLEQPVFHLRYELMFQVFCRIFRKLGRILPAVVQVGVCRMESGLYGRQVLLCGEFCPLDIHRNDVLRLPLLMGQVLYEVYHVICISAEDTCFNIEIPSVKGIPSLHRQSSFGDQVFVSFFGSAFIIEVGISRRTMDFGNVCIDFMLIVKAKTYIQPRVEIISHAGETNPRDTRDNLQSIGEKREVVL